MTDLSPRDIDEILCSSFVANTGAYLLRRLRSNSTVQKILSEVTTDQLISIAQQVFSGELRSVNDIALGYCIIGAASFLDGDAKAKVLAVSQPEKLNWGSQMIAEMNAYSPITAVQTFSAQPRVVESSVIPVATATSVKVCRPTAKAVTLEPQIHVNKASTLITTKRF